MAIATTVRRYLTSNGIAYQEHVHRRANTLEETVALCGVEPSQMARAVLLADSGQLWMAIVPLNTVIDLAVVERVSQRALKPIAAIEANRRFPDCEPGCHPPVPEAYALKAMVDKSLFTYDRVWLEAGSHTGLVAVTAAGFASICRKALKGNIAKVVPTANEGCQIEFDTSSLPPLPSEEAVRKKLEQIYRLPAIPAVATQILQLVANPNSTAKDLAELVEMDPSVAAQVIRYARSSFFGYRGSVDSIQTAITRVLGFDIVSNLALGIAAGKDFKLSAEGPLGLENFWRHAVQTAALVQALTRVLPKEKAVKPGTAYLCGLLHNFGVLLLGHLFQPEYFLLNKMCLANPQCSLADIERRIVCVGDSQRFLTHAQMGAWLMKHWNMPDEVVETANCHHDAAYSGPFTGYIALVNVANALLARDRISDVNDTLISQNVLDALGLSLETVEKVYENVKVDSAELDRMAALMAGKR